MYKFTQQEQNYYIIPCLHNMGELFFVRQHPDSTATNGIYIHEIQLLITIVCNSQTIHYGSSSFTASAISSYSDNEMTLGTE